MFIFLSVIIEVTKYIRYFYRGGSRLIYSLSITQVQDVLVEHGLIREIIVNGELIYRIKDPALLEKKITELSYFSKTAHENTLFICKGAAFKEEYLSDALNHGAQFFVAEQLYQVSSGIGFIVHDVRKAMAVLAKTFYQAPDERLKIIGITATKGKTTTTYYAKDILQANFPDQVGFISGEEMCLDGTNYMPAHLSTPESLELYSYLAQAVENNLNYMVLEVSSQAYKLDRVYDLDLDVGIFMNITEDHVSPEEHQSMEEYFYCKRQIMHHARTVILSNELPHLSLLKEEAESHAEELLIYGPTSQKADYYYQALSSKEFELRAVEEDFLALDGIYSMTMPGEFNMANAAAALLGGSKLGTSSEKSRKGLENSVVPGRMETYLLDKGTVVIIDFAHNYASLQAVLTYVNENYPDYTSTVVVGSQSHRSELRWSGIARALSQYGDKVYLTADDPGFMHPDEISQEISKEITSDINIYFVPDREEAVRSALQAAEAKEVVILAGKGRESSQFVNGKNEAYIGDYQILKDYKKNNQ